MTPDRREGSQPELKIGEMPKARYLLEAGDTVGSGTIKWIGIEAYAPDGQVKKFLWWRNFKVGDLNKEKPRHDTAALVTRLKIETQTDSAIGPAIDLSESNSRTGKVKVVEEPDVYGVYVEAEKRPMFNFMTMMQGVKSEAELRRQNPAEFADMLKKAEAVLPRPKSATEKVKDLEQRKLDERIKFVTGDITNTEADAIVCPSLPDLDVIYTGVAGAVMRKGGDRIFEEARTIGEKAKKQNPKNKFPVPLYSAHLTNGGNLPKTKHVIHSVAVNFTDEGPSCDPEAIFKSAWNVLDAANTSKLSSVAFPALGAGLYGVPLEESFGAIAQAADRYLKEHPETTLKRVTLVSFDTKLPKPTLVEELVADQWVRSLRARKN